MSTDAKKKLLEAAANLLRSEGQRGVYFGCESDLFWSAADAIENTLEKIKP